MEISEALALSIKVVDEVDDLIIMKQTANDTRRFRHGKMEAMQHVIRKYGVPDTTSLLLKGVDRNGELVWEVLW